MTKQPEIDFDNALNRGATTYTGPVGDWWLAQCGNPAHQRAYRAIAERLAKALGRRSPRLIVEYACGPGYLLRQLAIQFPKAQLIGIDGSPEMLELAERRLARLGAMAAGRIELWESHLPNFSLPRFEADAVVFAFPNICPFPDEQDYYDKHGSRHRADRAVARLLAEAREPDPADETVFDDPETLMTAMLDAKVIARNLRRLVCEGGICLRAEYANAPREELTDLVNMRLDFEGGAMGSKFKGKRPEAIFNRIAHEYRRSSVILDVYHQTGDEDNLHGGFLMNVLKAI